MNYESMSDFEINKAVAVKLGVNVDAEQYEGLCDRDERVVLCHDEFDLSVGLDYCNNPTDAWPIIIENGIAPLAEGGKIYGATTDTYEYYEPHGNIIYSCEHKNPLRAAMIVFLMMSEEDVLCT